MRAKANTPTGLAAAVAALLALTACLENTDLERERPWFSHSFHAGTGVECTDCHEELEEGDGLGMPALELCMECHEEIDAEKPAEKHAAIFFPEGTAPLFKRVAHRLNSALGDEIIFSHNAHVEYGVECARCHVGIEESEAVSERLAVPMQLCMDCHAGLPEADPQDPLKAAALARNACADCHKDIRQDRKPPSHRGNFLRDHGQLAALRSFDSLPAECAICHVSRSSCDACHADMPPRDHTNFWRLRGHAFISSIDRERCVVCHQTGDFCMRCHQETRPLDHRGSYGSPINRHCLGCHLPLGGNRCRTCHVGTPSHDMAPPRPNNAQHMTNNSAQCRACHTPLQHLDNGDSCLFCHR